MPQSRMRNTIAVGEQVVARQEKGQRGIHRPAYRFRPSSTIGEEIRIFDRVRPEPCSYSRANVRAYRYGVPGVWVDGSNRVCTRRRACGSNDPYAHCNSCRRTLRARLSTSFGRTRRRGIGASTRKRYHGDHCRKPEMVLSATVRNDRVFRPLYRSPVSYPPHFQRLGHRGSRSRTEGFSGDRDGARHFTRIWRG